MKRDEKIERIARSMCAAAGHDPDMMVVPPGLHGEPERLFTVAGYAVPAVRACKMWELWARSAAAAIDAMKDIEPSG